MNLRPSTFCFVAVIVLSLALPLGAAAQGTKRTTSLPSCAFFASHGEIGRRLAAYQTQRPDLARAFTIGTSVDGRALWALEISANPGMEEHEPEVRIIGGIHGNECLSAEMVLQIARWLLGDYGQDPLVTAIVDGMNLVLVPLLNPDGYSDVPAHRSNARGVDLNRNLGFAWVGQSDAEGRAPFSEPETRALRDLSQARSFVLGLSYHTSAQYVNGPWNYTPHHPWDEALVDAIGRAYAGRSGYHAVFGWDWYNITGDVNDWSLGTRGTFDWTLELRSDHDLQWPVHRVGLRRFLAFALVGAHGTVTDARTGEPLEARIDVEPRGAPVFTDPEVGDYHRMLMPGTYTLTAVAPGYRPRSVSPVRVSSAARVRVDFALERSPAGEREAAFAVNQMSLPRRVDNDSFRADSYQNATQVWDALGPPDGRSYSLSPGGSITLDLGAGGGAVDRPGPDLLIESGTDSEDPISVLVAADQDGPFIEVGRSTGDLRIDVAPAGGEPVRYVRLIDVGGGPFNHPQAGYDVDAVVNLSPRDRPAPGPDGDGDADRDVDSDAGRPAGPDAGDGGSAEGGPPDAAPAEDAGSAESASMLRSARTQCGCRGAGGWARGSDRLWQLVASLLW